MFNNARHFKQETSQVYKDAETLERILKLKVRSLPKDGSPAPESRAEICTSMTQRLKQLYSTVRDHRDAHYRMLSPPFMHLPSRQEYPDYYDVIRKPIDLVCIQQKLAGSQYANLEELASDFCLLFENASKYNEPDSLIYKDALTLMKVCLEKKQQMLTEGGNTVVPDVRASVQEIMTNMFTSILNYADEEGRCLADSFQELPLVTEEGQGDSKVKEPTPSFAKLKVNLDRGRYRRLDRFQEDMFEVFEFARRVSRSDSQLYEDAIELQMYFIKKRDEVCKNGETFITPALSYTERILTLAVEQADASEESCEHGDVTYSVGDFVYIEPREAGLEHHIVGIEKLWKTEQGEHMLSGHFYLKPQETFHHVTRKFFHQEVFKSEKSDSVPLNKVLGKCYVMSVMDYFKMVPKGFQAKDIYVRLHRVFAQETSGAAAGLCDVTMDEGDVLDIERQVVKQYVDSSLQTTGYRYFEQQRTKSGWYKIGDHVFLRDAAGYQKISRIDRMWADPSNVLHFMGPYYHTPAQVHHNPTSTFYDKELLKSCVEDTHPLSHVTGRCVVMPYRDYVSCRLTEVPEKHVFLCESKYIEAEKLCKKFMKPSSMIKDNKLSIHVCDDEVYYLPKPIYPHKVPSPALLEYTSRPTEVEEPEDSQPPLGLDENNQMDTRFTESFMVGFQSKQPLVDHRLAVKEYSRSFADQDLPLPHELRPGPVLQRTMHYLLNNIADRGGEGKWGDWFDFLWNRTRGIRKDITQQQLCDLTSVELVEKCVRFHIYCGERLCEEDMMCFDAIINNENLTKCLQTLKELYENLADKQIDCPNEAEFRAYMVLMNLNSGEILREVQQLREGLRHSNVIGFVMQVYSALDSNNYRRFFMLVKRASFLNACIMHRYFYQVRKKAFYVITRAYNKKEMCPVEDLARTLAFDTSEEALGFCTHHGLNTEGNLVVLDRASFVEPETSYGPFRAQGLVESKQTASIGETINGAPLPENIIQEPQQNSFDESGRFIGKELKKLPKVQQSTTLFGRPTESEPTQSLFGATSGGASQSAFRRMTPDPPPALRSRTPDARQQIEERTRARSATPDPIRPPGRASPAEQVARSVTPEPQQRSTVRFEKEIAIELFLEVIGEFTQRISTNLVRAVKLYLDYDKPVGDDYINNIVKEQAREISEEAIDEYSQGVKEQEARNRAESSMRKAEAHDGTVSLPDRGKQKQEKYSGLTTPDQLLDSLKSSSTAKSLVTSQPSLHDSARNLSNGDDSTDNKSVLNLSNGDNSTDNSNGDISRENKSIEYLSNAVYSGNDKSVANRSNGNISRDDKSYPLACMINRSLPEIPIARSNSSTHLENSLKDKNPRPKAMILEEVDVCSDSSEFHLVLPNSHSNFIAFEEHNTEKKVVLMDSGDSHVSNNGDLQTETVSFRDAKAAFSNTVESYFRNETCDKDTYTSVDSQNCDKGTLPSEQFAVEHFKLKSNQTGASSSECEHKISGAISPTQSVSSSQSNFRSDTAQHNEHLATNMSGPIMTSCTSSLASSRANLSESHITQELQHLKYLVKSQGEEISKLKAHLSSLSSLVNTSAAQAQSQGCSSFTSPALVTLIYKHLQHDTTPQTDPSTDTHSANQSAAAVDTDSSACRITFLLDEGRLKLATVLDAFQLTTLKIISGESSFIVSANSEGYIPLTFGMNSIIQVTSTPIPPTDRHSNA